MWYQKTEDSRQTTEVLTSRVPSSVLRFLTLCLLSSVFCPLIASTPNAPKPNPPKTHAANPTGGSVQSGSATINNNGNTTVIDQTSNRAVINWTDFSIAKGHTVQFIDPSASAITLNRVTGGNSSLILGHLTSNGIVYLINPNGIIFGRGSELDAAGLLASTANISNSDFMSGNFHFTNAPANSFIINQGTITVANYGLAVLVAPSVTNSGVINATLGKVVLGAGNAFTLDLYGDGLINFDVSSNGFLVNNPGVINANGGTVMLTTSAAGALLENTINTSGIISAQSVAQHNGKVIFEGPQSTTLNISGTVDVSGSQKNETGGVVQASTGNINLLNGSTINATGYSGGGTVEIGGGPQGTGPLAHALNVTMDSGATINASATQAGDGGHVVFWSDQLSQIFGTIFAKGGALSGNGGLVETSGHQIDVTGIQVNTSALHGLTGNWLLDPWDIMVVNGSGITNGGFSGTTFVPTGTSTIGALTLSSQLGSTNVTLDTCGGSGACPGSDVGNITFNNNTDTVNVLNNAFNVYASNNIAMNFNNVITGTGSGPITLWAGRQNTGAGTITTGVITQAIAGANPLNIYYNPAVFGTTDADISLVSPTAPANAYSLVFNSVAGRQLSDISGANLAGNYALAQNIDGSLLGPFTPIGIGTPFSGKFTGNGFTINDLTINPFTNFVGLFGSINGATISNTTLSNSAINGSGFLRVGGFVGIANNSTLNNLTGIDLTVTGNQSVGGIVGFATNTSISNVALFSSNPSNVSVFGGVATGGIVGTLNTGSTLTNAFSNATVATNALQMGGIAGSNVGNISNVMYSGNVIADTGATVAGGLVGYNVSPGNITNAVAVGTLSGPAVSPHFGSVISFNFSGATVTSPVYYSTTTYGGIPSINGFTGPDQSGSITGLASSSLTNATTLGLGGAWQSNNPSFQFVSLSFCGNACIVNFASPPPTPPPPTNPAVTSTQSILNNSNPTPPEGDLGNGSEENVSAVPTTGDPNSDTVVVSVTPDKPGLEHANPQATARMGEKYARDRMCH